MDTLMVDDADETLGNFHAHSITQDILDSLPSLYYMLRPDGTIVRCNVQSSAVTGYAHHEQIGMNILSLFDEAGRHIVSEGMKKVFTTGYAEIEADLITRDGRRIPHLFSGKCISIDTETYLSGLGLDLSRQKELERRLEKQARYDSLTGLANRGHFLERCERQIALARHDRTPLSLLVMDVDHFKSVNDTYGHQVGDSVLRRVGAVLAEAVRDADIAARVGGEEFAILLDNTDCAGAEAVAQRICQVMRDHRIPTKGGHSFMVTMSIGVAELADGDPDIDAVIARADKGLYQAKHGGRDQVVAIPLHTVLAETSANPGLTSGLALS